MNMFEVVAPDVIVAFALKMFSKCSPSYLCALRSFLIVKFFNISTRHLQLNCRSLGTTSAVGTPAFVCLHRIAQRMLGQRRARMLAAKWRVNSFIIQAISTTSILPYPALSQSPSFQPISSYLNVHLYFTAATFTTVVAQNISI